MPTTKRLALCLIVATALPLLAVGEAMAGGAFFPAFPPTLGLTALKTSGQVTAVIVLDPNGPVSSGAPATPTGTFGTIAITRQNVGTAAATFRVDPGSSLGELRFGCNPLLDRRSHLGAVRTVSQGQQDPRLPDARPADRQPAHQATSAHLSRPHDSRGDRSDAAVVPGVPGPGGQHRLLGGAGDAHTVGGDTRWPCARRRPRADGDATRVASSPPSHDRAVPGS